MDMLRVIEYQVLTDSEVLASECIEQMPFRQDVFRLSKAAGLSTQKENLIRASCVIEAVSSENDGAAVCDFLLDYLNNNGTRNKVKAVDWFI
jgi:hypothetical protein